MGSGKRTGAQLMRYVIGVDVGTGSVRAGVYDTQGIHYGYAVKDIAMHVPQPGWAEQSSHDIWSAVGSCVKAALKGAGLTGKDIFFESPEHQVEIHSLCHLLLCCDLIRRR